MMSVSLVVPEAPVVPKFIKDFKSITNITVLKEKFKKTHIWENEWSKPFIAGSIALAILAAFAYRQAHQYVAIGLGILTLCSALNSRVKVLKPTPEYTKLCNTFNNVIRELRGTWETAAGLISKEVMKKECTSVEKADQEASRLLQVYKKNLPAPLTIDPFQAIEKKPMRDQFQKLYPIAEEFVETTNITEPWQDPQLPPGVILQLAGLYKESERLVRGSFSFISSDRPYVENTLSGEYVTSAPWPAPPLA